MRRESIVLVQPDLQRRTAWAAGLSERYHVVRCDTPDQGVFAAQEVDAIAIIAEAFCPHDLEVLLGGDEIVPRPPIVLIATTDAPILVRHASAIAVHVARPPIEVLLQTLRDLLIGPIPGPEADAGPCMLPFRMPPERIAKWRLWLTGARPARRERAQTAPAPWLSAVAALTT